jgi:hypothetical protein
MLSARYLFVSLIWSSVGMGYFIYGKRQASWVPMAAGVAMMAACYLIESTLLLSLSCAGLMGLAYLLGRMGY